MKQITLADIAERAEIIFNDLYTVNDILKGDNMAMNQEAQRIAQNELKLERMIAILETAKTKSDIAWALDNSYYVIYYAHSHEHLYVDDRLKFDFQMMKTTRLELLNNLLSNRGEKLEFPHGKKEIFYYKDVKVIYDYESNYVVIRTSNIMDKRVERGRVLFLIATDVGYANMARNMYDFYNKEDK